MPAVKIADAMQEAEANGVKLSGPRKAKAKTAAAATNGKAATAEETKLTKVESNSARLEAIRKEGPWTYADEIRNEKFQCAVTNAYGRHPFVLKNAAGKEILVGPTGYRDVLGLDEKAKVPTTASNGKVGAKASSNGTTPARGEDLWNANLERIHKEHPGPYVYVGRRTESFVCDVTNAHGGKPHVVRAADGHELLVGPTGLDKLGVKVEKEETEGSPTGTKGRAKKVQATVQALDLEDVELDMDAELAGVTGEAEEPGVESEETEEEGAEDTEEAVVGVEDVLNIK